MSGIDSRKYRLEIAVKKIFNLVDVNDSARLVFSAQLKGFPEIFIRPQTGAGGGFVEVSPVDGRILSLTYNVCHKAEFHLTDDERTGMFPSSCSCRLYDEVRRLSVPNSPLTWVCPCPLVSDRTIPAPAQDTFAMCTAEGVIMGRVEMSCCVVPVGGELDPSLTTDPAPNGGLIVTSPVQFNGPAGVIAVNGKRYVIRVLIDGYPGRSRKKKSSGVTVSSSGTAAIVNSKSEGPTEGAHGGHESHAGKGGTTDDTEKDCLLYSMQHNVVFQLQSICEVLRATLKRDFKALDSRSINKSQKDNAESLERSVKGIRKYSNVMLQLTVQLIESAGGTYKGSADCGGTGAISAEGFPLPRKGSLAQFLVNNVLSQLESLGACLYHVTKVHRQQLEVPMSVLEHQHVKCLRKLDCSIQDANKQVNILVQSSLCEDVHRKESSISSVSSQGSSLSMMTDQRSNSSNSRILSVYGGLPSTKRGSGHQSKSLREVTVPGVQSRILPPSSRRVSQWGGGAVFEQVPKPVIEATATVMPPQATDIEFSRSKSPQLGNTAIPVAAAAVSQEVSQTVTSLTTSMSTSSSFARTASDSITMKSQSADVSATYTPFSDPPSSKRGTNTYTVSTEASNSFISADTAAFPVARSSLKDSMTRVSVPPVPAIAIPSDATRSAVSGTAAPVPAVAIPSDATRSAASGTAAPVPAVAIPSDATRSAASGTAAPVPAVAIPSDATRSAVSGTAAPVPAVAIPSDATRSAVSGTAAPVPAVAIPSDATRSAASGTAAPVPAVAIPSDATRSAVSGTAAPVPAVAIPSDATRSAASGTAAPVPAVAIPSDATRSAASGTAAPVPAVAIPSDATRSAASGTAAPVPAVAIPSDATRSAASGTAAPVPAVAIPSDATRSAASGTAAPVPAVAIPSDATRSAVSGTAAPVPAVAIPPDATRSAVSGTAAPVPAVAIPSDATRSAVSGTAAPVPAVAIPSDATRSAVSGTAAPVPAVAIPSDATRSAASGTAAPVPAVAIPPDATRSGASGTAAPVPPLSTSVQLPVVSRNQPSDI